MPNFIDLKNSRGATLYGKDSSGNAGFIQNPIAFPLNIKSLGAVGDSIVDACNRQTPPTSITNAAGVLTAVVSNHQLRRGSPFYITGAEQDGYNSVLLTVGSGTTSGTLNNVDFAGTAVSPATGANMSIACPLFGSDKDFIQFAACASGGGFVRGRILGCPGKTAGYIIDHIDWVLDGPDSAVLEMSGVNDVFGSLTADEIFANRKLIWDAILAVGKLPVVSTVLPMNNTVTGWSSAIFQKLLRLNKLVRDYAETADNIILVDGFSALVDPLSATGNNKSNYTIDGKHPSGLGAYYLGLEICRALRVAFGESINNVNLPSSVADSYLIDAASNQLIDYPLGSASGGTVTAPATGAAVTGWTLARAGSATVVGSVDARADGFGSDQTIAITSTANNDGATLTSTYMAGRVSAGDIISAVGEINISGATNLKRLSVSLTAADSGSSESTGIFTQSSAIIPQTDRTFKFRTPETEIFEATAIMLTITATFSGAGGATIKAGRLGINKRQTD